MVLGQPLAEAAKVTLDYKAPVAAVIMVLMVAMMVFDFIPVAPVTAVMIAGILMVLTGCFRNVEAAYKTINWESIVLIAAMLPMSLALEKTGASEYISNSLVSELGTYGPLALMAGIYFTTSLMTMFISNTATAVLLAPYRDAKCNADRGKSRTFSLCGDTGGKYVFRFAILHSAQCAGDARRTIYLYGLCKGRAAVADYYGHCHGAGTSFAVSFLSCL
mgnify:FL=1